MSYDPTCKVWKRRYKTNLDPDEDGPVEYEVEAKFMRWDRDQLKRQDSDDPASRPNVGRILEYRPWDKGGFTATSGFRCPLSANTAIRSSPGWRRTCERFVIHEIKEQMDMDAMKGVLWGELHQDKWGQVVVQEAQSLEIRIKAAGPWECVEYGE